VPEINPNPERRTARRRVHVVAGVLRDPSGRVLLSRRPGGAHLGGLWEFPGGKVEGGENVESALRRELEEELGITVSAARPLIRVPYDYPDRSVLLDVWRVTRWQRRPRGRERQDIDWVVPEMLHERPMPPADVPVVNAIRLPSCYAITPPPAQDLDRFLDRLETLARGPAGMVQLRAHELDDASYVRLARACASICEGHGVELLINRDPGLVAATGAHGVHLTSTRLRALEKRPLGKDRWVGASCHDAFELRQARQMGVDFAVLSPLRPTPGHPHRAPLGWEGFRQMAAGAGLPIYALGGVALEDLEVSWQNGAQGVAGIRAFWPG
jgi:8-oxo-dGTP diphosphatase